LISWTHSRPRALSRARTVDKAQQNLPASAKPTSEEAKDYLGHILSEAFPQAKEVIEAMRVVRVVKDVTWNTLNEPGFVDWLKKQFPMRKDFQQPFEMYRAAREANKTRSGRA
jgi:hypothetical protein